MYRLDQIAALIPARIVSAEVILHSGQRIPISNRTAKKLTQELSGKTKRKTKKR